jgi:hypothetical protein
MAAVHLSHTDVVILAANVEAEKQRIKGEEERRSWVVLDCAFLY